MLVDKRSRSFIPVLRDHAQVGKSSDRCHVCTTHASVSQACPTLAIQPNCSETAKSHRHLSRECRQEHSRNFRDPSKDMICLSSSNLVYNITISYKNIKMLRRNVFPYFFLIRTRTNA